MLSKPDRNAQGDAEGWERRVRKAIERRGRPLEDGRLDVEIALLLCRRFPAILEPNWR